MTYSIGHRNPLFINLLNRLQGKNVEEINQILSEEKHNELIEIIKNDDVDYLQTILAQNPKMIGERIQQSVFAHCSIIQSSPTILQYAAFVSAIKCFKFLLLNGADPLKKIHNLDENRHRYQWDSMTIAFFFGNFEQLYF